MTFDESTMLNPKKKCLDAGKDHGVKEKVGLEINASENIQEDILAQVDEEEVQHPEEENAPQEQQYNLVKDREGGRLDHLRDIAMQIWLLIHLVWQRILKFMNRVLIMRPSLVES